MSDVTYEVVDNETIEFQVDPGAISNHSNLTNVTEEQHRTTEQLQDHVATLIDGGTNITINYNDSGDTLTIDSTAGGKTEEEIEDIVANALSGSGKASVTYDDANDTITIDVQANQEIDVQDGGSSVQNDPSFINATENLTASANGSGIDLAASGGGGGGGSIWTWEEDSNSPQTFNPSSNSWMTYNFGNNYNTIYVRRSLNTKNIYGASLRVADVADHNFMKYSGNENTNKKSWDMQDVDGYRGVTWEGYLFLSEENNFDSYYYISVLPIFQRYEAFGITEYGSFQSNDTTLINRGSTGSKDYFKQIQFFVEGGAEEEVRIFGRTEFT